MQTLNEKNKTVNSRTPEKTAVAERLALEGAFDLVNGQCTDPDCHGDNDPRHTARARAVMAYAAGLRNINLEDKGAGSQWLEVNCSHCGLAAWGSQDEIDEAEKIKASHSETCRGSRVNVELFFRECISTQITELGAPLSSESPQCLDRN